MFFSSLLVILNIIFVKKKVVIGALRVVTPKMGEQFQHIPEIMPELSVQKSAGLKTAKILHRSLKFPGLW